MFTHPDIANALVTEHQRELHAAAAGRRLARLAGFARTVRDPYPFELQQPSRVAGSSPRDSRSAA